MRRAVLALLLCCCSCPTGPNGSEAPVDPTHDDVVVPDLSSLAKPDPAGLQRRALALARERGVGPASTGPGPEIGPVVAGVRRLNSFEELATLGPEPIRVDLPETIFTRAPYAEITPAGELVIRWETRRETLAAALYVGARLEEDPLSAPRYRLGTVDRLAKRARKHEVRFALQGLLLPKYDVDGIVARGYGEVAWRIEQPEATGGSSTLYDGRTAFGVKLNGAIASFTQLPTVVLGPLVHMVTDTSAVVMFETDVPVAAAVGVGSKAPLVSDAIGTRHEVRVNGLESGQHFAYRVAVANGERSSLTPLAVFRTIPKRGPLVVAIMSDSRAGSGAGRVAYHGVNAEVLHTLFVSSRRAGAQAIFFPGDLVDGYALHGDDLRWQLRQWLKIVEGVHGQIPVFTGIGNHEVSTEAWSDRLQIGTSGSESGEAIFADVMVNPAGAPPPERDGAPTYDEAVYSVDLGPVHFVMLNTNYWWASQLGHERFGGRGNREGVLMDNQLDWLEKDLAAAAKGPSKHIVVLGHEPAFPVAGHARDAMWWFGKIPEVNAMRERFWKMLAEYGVIAYVSGDEHNYSRATIGPETVAGAKRSVHSVISGGCGAPYYALDPPTEYAKRVVKFSAQQHYTLWSFDPGGEVRLRVVGLTGEVIEDVALE